ncbi:MAG: hypothetical protein FWE09_04280 [Treponema sp.]|nr:hypothetical protein [Treponema sp.]
MNVKNAVQSPVNAALKGFKAAFLCALIIAAFNACPGSLDDKEPPYRITKRSYAESVQRVVFTEDTATVSFTNLNHHSIYLVRVNKSADIIAAANTGAVRASSGGLENNILLNAFEEDLPLPGYPRATAFNANPPPIDRAASHTRAARNFFPPAVGDTRMFWVESHYNSSGWVEKPAALMATGEHGNIWVMDSRLTEAQAQALAEKFDIIYPAATNILGYEYGGGPDGDGGKDGDPKIQILVYDMLDADGKEAMVAGYFWGKDFYEQSVLDHWPTRPRTNLAEIFYINAGVVIRNRDWIFSTLGHELQHMVNFNMKRVKHDVNSAAWYNELLSAMTQDLIDEAFLGIPLDNPNNTIKARMPRYRMNYNQIGVTEWDGSSNAYATAVAFGAYLLRNYGGADLLKNILANDKTNIESISLALDEISPGMDFESALLRFGEAMIFSGSLIPDGANTFDRTITTAINGFTYTVYGFDLWNIFGQPLLAPVNDPNDMHPHSVTIHDSSAWRNIRGDFSITLEKPNDPNVELYLMVR